MNVLFLLQCHNYFELCCKNGVNGNWSCTFTNEESKWYFYVCLYMYVYIHTDAFDFSYSDNTAKN